jgi:hypothetical protein
MSSDDPYKLHPDFEGPTRSRADDILEKVNPRPQPSRSLLCPECGSDKIETRFPMQGLAFRKCWGCKGEFPLGHVPTPIQDERNGALARRPSVGPYDGVVREKPSRGTPTYRVKSWPFVKKED